MVQQVPKGLEVTQPDYLKKADYGKVPQYISMVKVRTALHGLHSSCPTRLMA